MTRIRGVNDGGSAERAQVRYGDERGALTQNDKRWRGYEDYRTSGGDAPIPAARWDARTAVGYEEGRLIASELARYGDLPAWLCWYDPPEELLILIHRWQAEHPDECVTPPPFGVEAEP